MVTGAHSDPAPGQWVTSVSATADTVVWETTGPQQVHDASEFTGFVFDRAGRLTTWLVKPGLPLADAVGRTDDTVSSDGISVRVTTGYRTSGGDLQIAFQASGGHGSAQAKAYLHGGNSHGGADQPYLLETGGDSRSTGWTVIPHATWGGRQVFEINYQTTQTTAVPIRQRPWHNQERTSP